MCVILIYILYVFNFSFFFLQFLTFCVLLPLVCFLLHRFKVYNTTCSELNLIFANIFFIFIIFFLFLYFFFIFELKCESDEWVVVCTFLYLINNVMCLGERVVLFVVCAIRRKMKNSKEIYYMMWIQLFTTIHNFC